MRAEILVNEGYKDPADIARMDLRFLIKLLRLSEEDAQRVIDEAGELDRLLNEEKTKGDDDAEIDELVYQGSRSLDVDDSLAGSVEAAFEDLVAKTKRTPLLDPEKVDHANIPQDAIRFWLQLRGVGEQTAATLYTAGFQAKEDLVNASIDDIAYRTGLPLKFIGKIYAEASKA